MYYDLSRKVKIEGHYDVVVSGGGPAGFCAAVQAARAGMKTALIEQYGALGGAITVGGNPEIALFYTGDRQVISGIGWETVKRLEKECWAWIPEFKDGIKHSKLGVSVNAPMLARLMDEMCLEAGVKLFLHQNVVDVAVTTTANGKSFRDRSFSNAMQEGQLQLEDHWSSPDSGYEIFEKNGNNINHIVFNSTDGDSRTMAEIEGGKSVGR